MYRKQRSRRLKLMTMKNLLNTPSVEVQVHPNLSSKNDNLSGFFFTEYDAINYLKNIKNYIFTAKINNVLVNLSSLK